MSASRAAVLIDHHHALVVQFDAQQSQSTHVHDHVHDTRQHRSAVRTEHEFFADVCDALTHVSEILIAGSHLAQSDFRHFVEKHRPQVARQITGWETVDHRTEGELLALARKFFLAHDRLVGTRAVP